MNDILPIDLYVYRARVAKPPHGGHGVYDGDTWWLQIDPGFDRTFRDRFRARTFDTPEVASRDASDYERAKGIEARDVVRAWFAESPNVLVRTYKASEAHDVDDRGKYGRWLAEPFVLSADGQMERHLSDVLVEQGLATIWPTRWYEVHDPLRAKRAA